MAPQRNVFRVVILAVLMLASAAQAQTFRCEHGLAGTGDSKASVLQKCGEPSVRDQFCQMAEPASASGPRDSGVTVNVLPCVTVDEWTFNPGKGKFLTTLRFENGQLSSISQGDRVRD